MSRDLRVVGNHAITEVWEDDLAFKLHALLDSNGVKWTSTDVVRIGYVGESSAPVILWIGVVPSTLSGVDGVDVASKCHNLLEEYNITDIDVEIRESVVTRLVGPDPVYAHNSNVGTHQPNTTMPYPPKLLRPAYNTDPIATIRDPLTTTLSLPICAESMRSNGGTGGFFMTDDWRPGKLFLVTARHVLFKDNNHFERKHDGQLPRNVILFDDEWFEGYRKSIKNAIVLKKDTIQGLMGSIRSGDIPATEKLAKLAQIGVEEAAKEQLENFCEYVSRWEQSNRILGHIILSPPITVGDYDYIEDWAVIEIDPSQVDAHNFLGNAIDLGTGISSERFLEIMRFYTNDPNSIKYPSDRLLRLNGTIPDEEMRNCFSVIKHGSSSGLSFGISNNICSFTHEDFDVDMDVHRKEWCILPCNKFEGFPTFPLPTHKLTFFSEEGDSGSVIVDGYGRIGGLLTGGSIHKINESPVDITYATPISFLLERMRGWGLEPDLATSSFTGRPSLDLLPPLPLL